MAKLCSGPCGLVAPSLGKRWARIGHATEEECPVCGSSKSSWVSGTTEEAAARARATLEYRLSTAVDSEPPKLLKCGHVCRRQTMSDPMAPYRQTGTAGMMISSFMMGVGVQQIADRCCVCTKYSGTCSECIKRQFDKILLGYNVPRHVAGHLANIVLHDLRGAEVSITSEQNQARILRLQSNTMVLYHQTSPAAAEEIVRKQSFLRGSDGLAGGGIYFAESPEATDRKAQNKGVILQATVLLGNIKHISSSGDRAITFGGLLQEGYDSVLIPRNGNEYVVYNYDQVKNISVCHRSHSYAMW